MEARKNRERLVQWALAMTRGTQLAPCPDELALLEQFMEGQLTIDEVVALVAEKALRQPAASPAAEAVQAPARH